MDTKTSNFRKVVSIPNVIMRRAALADVTTVVRKVVDLHEQWGIDYMGGGKGTRATLIDECTDWLLNNLDNPNYPLYLALDGDTIIAGCGGTMRQWMYPPNYPYVAEYIWWLNDGYPKRIAVQLWRIVERWGIANGARMSLRSTMRPDKQGTIEVSRWRRV